MKCRYCGTEIREDSKFCPHCGKKFETDEKRYSNNNTVAIGVIVFGAIVLLGVIVFGAILLAGRIGKNNNNVEDKTTDMNAHVITESEITTEEDTEEYIEDEETEEHELDETDESSSDEIPVGDMSLISGKEFIAIGCKHGIDNFYSDISIENDGSFHGTEHTNEDPPTTNEFTGKFGNVRKGEDLIYFAEIEEVDPSYWQEMPEVEFYDKGFPVAMLPEYIKDYVKDGHYGQMIDSQYLPCMIIYNDHIEAVYAEKSYIDSIEADVSTGESTSTNTQAFYGVWCYGAKEESAAKDFAEKLKNEGFSAEIFMTTDWENLSSEKYYVVTAGVYSSESSANDALSDVQDAGYGDAYVKYTGEYIGR